jgi:hypothetical protein
MSCALKITVTTVMHDDAMQVCIPNEDNLVHPRGIQEPMPGGSPGLELLIRQYVERSQLDA